MATHFGARFQLNCFPQAPRSPVVSTFLPSAFALATCRQTQKYSVAVRRRSLLLVVQAAETTMQGASLRALIQLKLYTQRLKQTNPMPQAPANLVARMLATSHRRAPKFPLYRAVPTVWTLLEPRTHHILRPLLVPNLRQGRRYASRRGVVSQ